MRKPTLVDVAREAGVSRATASRVLAGASTVDQSMVLAVRQAAARLSYRTNVAARSLAGGRTGAVAIVLAAGELDPFSGSFVAAPLKGATATLLAASQQPALFLADPSRLDTLVAYLAAQYVDGAVVILQHEISTITQALSAVDLPIVFVGRPMGESTDGVPFVDSDNYAGGRLAAERLVALGRTRIGVISGPVDMAASSDRVRGWRDVLTEYGLGTRAVARGDFTMASGSAAMARLLSRHPDLDAVFAGSDLMAVGAMRVLEASGRIVPDDIALVGFDDTVVAATSEPPLTSVRQPLEQMGRVAAELVLDLVAGRSVRPHWLDTTLVIRDSA
ncbi:MAG TPA: LacI family DNA-binding transcriptional regulator [Plantibacter sp.]|uniref:LacI family DNA-binding transcriptional regulator n=1 Tax=unclassified Plantibacter TaxID=2624265 RepID=UPI002C1DACD9|nr:LacI family DNA-binding transcriptional regulator [Plantibacter sp.]